ncbi:MULTISPECIES: aspartate aminotransferase family protein [Rhodobacterales]|jgi:adenosylmethionine-8-amino-7-oxononanoate aminotransferase|uniref:aminotransferase family protein n=1 Tax=Rhodobacterales TaxID=204455 RepID=UPI00237F0C27|nr:aspartate aminotransferase family protein [Phaeobacter gallaeciensis]MDE4142808.1 aspartate aminotransferase family protein [Phaeobacter gallaeciensis]MDE4151222.1 aspartate aminotransferase family protein [Phaeobacter gallaeciensis]MDE4155484.1 aspartate aminotransferase family protein [Phaeobacter gallaeciensis]MDE4230875.1 aspartate aminotransferase family protein [Phaeobacter gallaeciensis]MDE4259950.1 aspartate aminotransferase family protein [Phaeobacter gallaeciensis]
MSNLFYQGRGRKPVLEQARGVYMWDKDGRRYLDGSSGAMVCNIGHSNENVLAAMQRQMEKSTFGYRLHFETEASEQLAARLAGRMPKGLNKVFFVSGGSEAVESGMKMARQYALATGQDSRWKVISRSPSYHGCTLGALAVTGYTTLSQPFAPMMREMPKVPAPRAYLDGLDPNDRETGLHYADMLEAKILAEGADSVLAFILEPVGGASTGALVPPLGYMERIREICDRYGVLLIMDEVMTGAGRTGTFLGCEHWNAQPDIVVMSKGIGSGYVPLGAMIADERLVDPVLDAGGFAHGFTYAGNPLACAAGLAVVDEIEAQDLCRNATEMGDKLIARLHGLMQKHEIIGDVRGKGLLTAFEFMSDRDSKAPLPKGLNAYQRFVDIAYDKGLIVYSRRTRDGVEGDHILVCPPLIVNDTHLDEIIEGLDASLVQFTDEIHPALKVG